MVSQSTGGTNAQRGFLHRYGDIIRELPEPGEEWLARDSGIDNIESYLTQFRQNGAVKKVGETYAENCGSYIGIWKTSAHVYQLAHSPAHTRGDTGILPCGHDAIRNERGVDGITCGVCGTVHDRSEVKA